jgi:hypothetical protein
MLIRRSSVNPSRLSLGMAAGSGETARPASGKYVFGASTCCMAADYFLG